MSEDRVDSEVRHRCNGYIIDDPVVSRRFIIDWLRKLRQKLQHPAIKLERSLHGIAARFVESLQPHHAIVKRRPKPTELHEDFEVVLEPLFRGGYLIVV